MKVMIKKLFGSLSTLKKSNNKEHLVEKQKQYERRFCTEPIFKYNKMCL